MKLYNMPKFFLMLCTSLLFVLLQSCASSGVQTSRFEIKEGNFYLDEQPIQLICGEMHYPRIPKEYWRDRMKRAKAMGINTVSAYVFWNYHERQPGVFDFEGQADIKRFIQIAQEEGLFVILRPGPYVCAEWDFGGYPSWLLKEEGMVYRSNDERFLQGCQNYIQRLGEELSDLTLSNGGPILMVQVENEYGSYGADKVYLGKLRDMIKEAGFNVPLMTCDGAGQMEAGRVEGTLSTVNGAVGEDIFKSVDRFHPGGPYFVAEFYPAWFDVWGTPHSYRDYKKPAEQLEWMVKNNVSVSIYMFHGGTNFDYTNGANTAYGYAPQPTSYDYDAPLGEYGNMYPKYWAFREVLQQHLYKDEQLPEVPAPNPIIEIEELVLAESASLAAAFEKTVEAEKPLCMEEMNQDFGYIHYETILNKKTKGTITIKDVRDYAVVLLNGKQVGSLDRRHRQSSMEIDVKEVPAKLEIIVENVGRVNYGADILNNRKGITEKVTIDDTELLGWKCTSLPLYKAPVVSFNYQDDDIKGQPAFHRATFTLDSIGDTFLDMSSWGKGAAWINGRSLGKFWNIGPQQTLYVPGPWLKKGQNELVVFAFEDTGARTVKGLKEPILDQLGADKNKREKSTLNYSLKPVLESGDVVLKAEMSNEQGWQEFEFDSPVTMRHLALEALSTNDGKPAGICELDVIDKDGNVLTKDTWKVVYTSSEVEDKGFAEYIIDGNLGTQWKAGENDQHPCVIVDLGEITSVSGVRLRHSYYEQSGRLKELRLYGRPQFFLLKE